MNAYYQRDNGEQYQIKITDESQESIDEVLDALFNVTKKGKYITEVEFKKENLMSIDIKHETTGNIIGELIFNKDLFETSNHFNRDDVNED